MLAGNVVGIKYDKCVDYRADSAELEAYGSAGNNNKIDYVVVDETDASTEEKSIEFGRHENRTAAGILLVRSIWFLPLRKAKFEITKYFDEDLSPFEVCAYR